MLYDKPARSLTEHFEALRVNAYQDSGGVWTIGYGHTQGVREGMTCTTEEADSWLMSDLADAVSAVNHLVIVPLTQGEFDALVDFVFNCGWQALARSELLIKLNRADFAGAAGELEKWDTVAGKVCRGLFLRRTAEQSEFKSTTIMPSSLIEILFGN